MREGLGIGIVLGLLLALILLGFRGGTPAAHQVISNREEIVWVDWKGRERKMVIHREVHT